MGKPVSMHLVLVEGFGFVVYRASCLVRFDAATTTMTMTTRVLELR